MPVQVPQPPLPQVSQSAFIFAMLVAAFVFYVTIKGDLPKWLGLLGLAQGAPGNAQAGTQPGASTQSFSIPNMLATGDNAAFAATMPFLALPSIASGIPNMLGIGGTSNTGTQ